MSKTKLITLMITVFVLLLPALLWAGTIQLPDTGQTTCYDGAGNTITCPTPDQPLAQDGTYIINPLFYTENSDGTVTDNNTGLIWQKDDDTILHNRYQASGTYDATYNPTSRNVCGELGTGWRLPTKREMMSIVNFGAYSPAIDTTYFPTTKSMSYWSSTTGPYSPWGAWVVDFKGGAVDYYESTNYVYVRCVLGGQYPTQSLIDNGNGTVTDNATGLMWQQGENVSVTWEDGLSLCEELSLGGHTDWRLPNIKELESLTSETRNNPAIDTSFFAYATASAYLSSTTYTPVGSHWDMYYVNFNGGSVNTYGKSFSYNVRCVRGGQSGPSDGLVAYWSFDNCDATDDSGNGHNGTIRGNLMCTEGKKGKAFQFDGSSFIVLPDSRFLDGNCGATISAWVNYQASAEYCDYGCDWTWHMIIGSSDGRPWTDPLTLQFALNRARDFGFSDLAAGTSIRVDPLTDNVYLSQNTWHLVTATLEQTPAGSQMKIYKDRDLAQTVSSDQRVCISYDADMETVIGALNICFPGNQCYTQPWIGYIDELRVYNRAVTEAEIQALYSGEFIIVDSRAEWRYSDKEQPGWTEISFDDSQWNTGITPFDDHSVTGWCDFGGNGTNWPLYTSLYLRKNIDVKQQGDLTLRIAIDNDFFLYFDGNEVAAINSEGCPYKWQYEYNIPSVNAGTHTIAVKIMDRGDDNGFDLMVSQGEGRLSNLEVSPSSHDFGEVLVGQLPIFQGFILKNTGDAEIKISNIYLSALLSQR